MSDHGNVVPLGKSLPTFAAVPWNGERPTEDWLTAKILGMLSIYYQPEDDADVIRLSLALWVETLSDLPREAIDMGIRKRLQSSSRQRPVPGEIRELALACLEAPAQARDDTPPPFGPGREIGPEERARAMEMLSQLSRELGGVRLKRIPAKPEGAS